MAARLSSKPSVGSYRATFTFSARRRLAIQCYTAREQEVGGDGRRVVWVKPSCVSRAAFLMPPGGAAPWRRKSWPAALFPSRRQATRPRGRPDDRVRRRRPSCQSRQLQAHPRTYVTTLACGRPRRTACITSVPSQLTHAYLSDLRCNRMTGTAIPSSVPVILTQVEGLMVLVGRRRVGPARAARDNLT